MGGTNGQPGTGNGDPKVGGANGEALKGGGVGTPPPSVSEGSGSNGGDETNSQQWAALVRREQTLTKQAAELKALESSIREREAKIAPVAEAFEKHKDNPQELLKALGINLPTSQEKPSTVEDRLDTIEKRFTTWEENLKKREEALNNQSTEAQIHALEERYIGELTGIVDKAGEKYEMTKALGGYGLALAVQRQHWQASGGVGQPLTPEEALGMVEEYLREEYADKLIGTSYLKGKLKPSDTPADQGKPPEKPSPGPKTLENNSPGAPDEKALPLDSDTRWNKLVEKRFGPKPPTPKAKPKGK